MLLNGRVGLRERIGHRMTRVDVLGQGGMIVDVLRVIVAESLANLLRKVQIYIDYEAIVLLGVFLAARRHVGRRRVARTRRLGGVREVIVDLRTCCCLHHTWMNGDRGLWLIHVQSCRALASEQAGLRAIAFDCRLHLLGKICRLRLGVVAICEAVSRVVPRC